MAVDTYAITSPHRILDAYQQYLGMNITLWNDKDYLYDGKKTWHKIINHTNASFAERKKGYRWRQDVFYSECAKQLKREGREWVSMVACDTRKANNPVFLISLLLDALEAHYYGYR